MGFNDLQGGNEANQVLQRRWGIQGAAPAPTMASELFPMIALEVDRPEWHFLGNSRLSWANTILAASPGNFSISMLTNPVGSGVIGVCERLVLGEEAGADRSYDIEVLAAGVIVAPTTTVRGFMRDSRLGWAAGFRTSMFAGTVLSAALIGDQVLRYRVPANTSREVELDMVMGPGSSLHVIPGAINTNTRVGFVWRERAAIAEELTGAQ